MPDADSPSCAAVIDRWVGRTAVVVGDVMLDAWCYGEAQGVCREAPVPVVTLRRRSHAAGGAGNTAANLATLGARSVLVGPVGMDPAARALRTCLQSHPQVVDRTVPVAGRATPVKRRLLSAGHILLREDEGTSPAPLPRSATDRLIEEIRAATRAAPAPVLLICDYGLGGVPERVRRWVAGHRDLFAAVGVDAHDLRPWQAVGPTLITPSFVEAAQAIGRPAGTGAAGRAGVAHEYARQLLDRAGAEAVAVTLDHEGAVVIGRDGCHHRTRATAVPPSHSVGAGDVYLSAATLAWAAGATIAQLAEIAQRAAQASLSSDGTCRCDRESLRQALSYPASNGHRPQLAAALPRGANGMRAGTAAARHGAGRAATSGPSGVGREPPA